ncbi:MAG: hypothetical protein L0L78_11210 [Tetragenococcus koreensis]|uniref:Uncharacterized protein n=1 Tax=Alkalibacterium gilvum TaxID=1130080 RepID=A0A1H6U2S3_9LACT|nr:hypothetical protein [Alkalibacterium gilvum]MDN6293855.1 hypothetical protein [Alkalibacterium sp.]MDN6736174.1 hypothetical protein [Tetragenococcus koreensis]SEI86629.1 hypothetical protein SAMN04488113_1274 [Alkalibacterium gilvum]
MSVDFSFNQIAILILLILVAALLQRLNIRDINKIHSKFSKELEMNSQSNLRHIVDYLDELSRIQAAFSLNYFYLILIAILLVNLYT